MDSDQTVFQRPACSRFVGLLLYSIVLPILACVRLCFIGAIGFAFVEQAGYPEMVVISVGAVISLFALAWLVRFAIVDYRRRAGVAVTIGSDSLSIVGSKETVRLAFADVENVRLVPCGADARCILDLSDGSEQALPVEVAPFSIARMALEAKMIRVLADRVEEAVAKGASIRLHERALGGWLRVSAGVLEIFAGMLAMLTLYGIPAGLMKMQR